MKTVAWIGPVLSLGLVACATTSSGGGDAAFVLTGGFDPDPQRYEVVPGGTLQISDGDTGCVGYLDPTRPHLQFDLSAPRASLGIVVAGVTDTTLLVRDPEGTWHCSDDSEFLGDLNPALELVEPVVGRYHLWVGSYERDYSGPAVSVLLTETAPEDWLRLEAFTQLANQPQVVGRDVALEPIDGIEFGDDASDFAHDGECDDPRFRGIGSSSSFLDSDRFHDASDCRTLYLQGRVEFVANPRPPLAVLELGGEYRGRLATGQVDPFTFMGAAGSEVYFVLSSTEFDTFLALYTPNGERFHNDDYAGRQDQSRLLLTLPATGEYRVEVTAYDAEGGGDYELRLESLHRVAAARHTGELSARSSRLGKGEYFDTWTFEGLAGQLVDIALDSDDFDSFLVLETPDGEIEVNDDDPEGVAGSRIVRELNVAGTYSVRVTSFAAGETGAYELRIVQSELGGRN